MTAKKEVRGSHSSQARRRPSEVEIIQLLQEAEQQYEEYRRLADLADISAEDEAVHPRYAWDKPIGLVARKSSNADLV